MKQFFKFVFASMVGFFLTMLLCFMLFFIIGASIASSGSQKAELKEKTVLELNLGPYISDRTDDDPLMRFINQQSGESEHAGLDRILATITAAKANENVVGIYFNSPFIQTGFANIEAIRRALLDFKSSGKFIYAYSEFFSEQSYYLASVADTIFMNPSGTFLFDGLSSQAVLYKDLYEKLGVDIQVFKVGKYKGATEAFTEDQLSEENRYQKQLFLDSLYEGFLGHISESRGISVNELKAMANELRINLPQDAVDNGLIDQLADIGELKDLIRQKLDLEEEDKLRFVKVNRAYRSNLIKRSFKKDKIAVIYAEGEISSGQSSQGVVGSTTLTKALIKARKDKQVKAIVLRVNSPGGSAIASDVIAREVERCKEVKPVIVSMGSLAASGGYLISTPADTIVAEATTTTGSIGVFMLLPNAQKLLNEKLGIKYEAVNTSNHSDIGRIDKPVTEAESKFFQNMVNHIYDKFLSDVAKGRNMSKDQVHEIGQGRVWIGSKAKDIGLVDVLGGLDKAIEIAAFKAGTSDYGIKVLPKKKPAIEIFMNQLNPDAKSILKAEMGSYYQMVQAFEQIQKMQGAQMRIPYLESIQ